MPSHNAIIRDKQSYILAFDSAQVDKIKRALSSVDDAGASMSERLKKFLTGKLSAADLERCMELFSETSEDEKPNILEPGAMPAPADPWTKAMTNKERNSHGFDQAIGFARRWGNSAGRIGINTLGDK